MSAIAETSPRELCVACLRAPVNCYCAQLRRFDPRIEFVILMHPRESRKHVATGRLAHLSLEGSHLLVSYNPAREERLLRLLADPARHCVVLYPGEQSVNLSHLEPRARANLVPESRRLTVLVIDGTWTTARKTMQRSPLLRALPRYSFDPPYASRIRLRAQPRPECFTTLEAIHHTIELLGSSRGFDCTSRAHDALLTAMDTMIDRQVELAKIHFPNFWGA